VAKLKAGGNVNIAFFGDSITDGAEVGQWWSDRSKTYTDLTIAGLRQQFPMATVNEVLAAEGGKSAVDSPDIFQKDVLDVNASGKKIDLVVIAMGMNDFGKPSMTPFKDAMRGYIDKARAAGIEVMLVTPIQSNEYFEPKQTDRVPRATIAQAIRDIGAEENVTTIDMWQEWQNQATHGIAPSSQLHNMFNHPGEPGHQLYAATILRAFKST
jgi:lysophospholipase L1-like esterase